MRCSQIKKELSQMLVGEMPSEIKLHLVNCADCSRNADDILSLRRTLRTLPTYTASYQLRKNIVTAMSGERQTSARDWPTAAQLIDQIRLGMMPYAFGTAASVIIAFLFLSMMFSGTRQLSVGSESAAMRPTSVMIASNRAPYYASDLSLISPADFARSRSGLASESPTVNPQGALVALTRSLVRGEMKDEEVVVVADVYSNGLARITQIIEPPQNIEIVNELEKALESDPAFAPFVPTTIESRPDNVRVVLRFQSVNVSTRLVRQVRSKRK